jgi:hypothetical protein
MPRPSFPAPLAILPALALAACAAAPPPAASPEPPPPGFASAGQPREPSPVDRDMLAIGKAEEEIDRFFPEAREPAGPSRKGRDLPPAPPPKPDQDGDKDSPKEARRSVTPGIGGDPCAVACKALASMASSADHLCQLAGENDGRCEDARSRVRGASARVKSSCPGCSVSTAPPASPKGPPMPEPPNGPAPGMPGSSPGMPIR